MDSNYMTGKSKGVTSIVLIYKGLTSHIEITVEGESLKHHGNLILVAGGGNDTNDPLFDSTQYLSDRVYKVFLTRVFAGSSGFAAYWFFFRKSFVELCGSCNLCARTVYNGSGSPHYIGQYIHETSVRIRRRIGASGKRYRWPGNANQKRRIQST
jgi:hypothetical protein